MKRDCNQAVLDFMQCPQYPKNLARNEDPVSSKIAAVKMADSGKLNEHEQIIVDTLTDFHNDKKLFVYWEEYADQWLDENIKGMTSHEMTKCCDLSYEQIHKRTRGLVNKDKIKEGIIRRCTVSGELMIEWSIR